MRSDTPANQTDSTKPTPGRGGFATILGGLGGNTATSAVVEPAIEAATTGHDSADDTPDSAHTPDARDAVAAGATDSDMPPMTDEMAGVAYDGDEVERVRQTGNPSVIPADRTHARSGQPPPLREGEAAGPKTESLDLNENGAPVQQSARLSGDKGHQTSEVAQGARPAFTPPVPATSQTVSTLAPNSRIEPEVRMHFARGIADSARVGPPSARQSGPDHVLVAPPDLRRAEPVGTQKSRPVWQSGAAQTGSRGLEPDPGLPDKAQPRPEANNATPRAGGTTAIPVVTSFPGIPPHHSEARSTEAGSRPRPGPNTYRPPTDVVGGFPRHPALHVRSPGPQGTMTPMPSHDTDRPDTLADTGGPRNLAREGPRQVLVPAPAAPTLQGQGNLWSAVQAVTATADQPFNAHFSDRSPEGDKGGPFLNRHEALSAALPASGPALHPVLTEGANARAQAELARETAQQIGAQVVTLGKGRFELSLAPAELGKVEMWLQDSDNRLTLTVNAERPETMDLIRRHIALLEQELRGLGFGSLSLQMGADGAPGSQGGQNPQQDSTIKADAAISESPQRAAPSSVAGDHLDLRL